MEQKQNNKQRKLSRKCFKSARRSPNKFLDDKQFKIIEELGKGSFSTVYKVQRLEDNKIYAMKKINLSELKPKDQKNALTEIRLLASFNHENIIGYKESFFDDEEKCLYVIMEYAKFGDIKQKIELCKKKNTYLSENFILKTCLQIAKALNTLHENNILHRDVKPANIFITDFDQVKLGDLNISKITEKGFGQTQAGTPYTSAPEVWLYRPYSSKADIWSLGCVLYEMATLNPPFTDNTMKGLYDKILNSKIQKIPNRYSKNLQNLIENCLEKDPTNRPSVSEIINNNFLKQAENLEKDRIQKKFQLIKTIVFPKNIRQINQVLPCQNYQEKQQQPQNEFKLISSQAYKKRQISAELQEQIQYQKQNQKPILNQQQLQQQQQQQIVNIINNYNNNKICDQSSDHLQCSTNDNSKNSIVLPPIENVQRALNQQFNQHKKPIKNPLLMNAIFKNQSSKFLLEDEGANLSLYAIHQHSHRQSMIEVDNGLTQNEYKTIIRKFASPDSKKNSVVAVQENTSFIVFQKKIRKFQQVIQNIKKNEDEEYSISPTISNEDQQQQQINEFIQKKQIQKFIELQAQNNSYLNNAITKMKEKNIMNSQQQNNFSSNNNSKIISENHSLLQQQLKNVMMDKRRYSIEKIQQAV